MQGHLLAYSPLSWEFVFVGVCLQSPGLGPSAELNSVSAHPLTTLTSNIATLLFQMLLLVQKEIDISVLVFFQAFFWYFFKPFLSLIRNSSLIFRSVKHRDQNHTVF